jgi:hypothetical protein
MPPPLRTNYSKRRLPPAQLKEQIRDLTLILSPDVTGQFHKLQDAYRQLTTLRKRDASFQVLIEWKKHGDETKLSQFMTEKIAELNKRSEQGENNRIKKLNMDAGPEYRALATEFLQSNFPPAELAQILKCKTRLHNVGSALFEKCDADILAKCPHVFDTVREVAKWRRNRNRFVGIDKLILRALPSDFQTLSSHNAGAAESALESLAHAAAFAAERD